MRRKIEPLLCELHAHTRWSDGASVAAGGRACARDPLANARGEGAALVAAHPYRARRGAIPSRLTLRWSRDWRRLRNLVDRWELFNRHDLYGWTAERGLPAVANGDFHRPEHLHGWKTLLPCAKDESSVVAYLRSPRPTFLARFDPPAELSEAA